MAKTIQSGDDDYLMNETIGGNYTPGHDVLLFSMGSTGSYAQSQTHGWIYQGHPGMDHCPLGESQSVPAQGRNALSQRINYTPAGSSKEGIFSLLRRIVYENSHASPGEGA